MKFFPNDLRTVLANSLYSEGRLSIKFLDSKPSQLSFGNTPEHTVVKFGLCKFESIEV